MAVAREEVEMVVVAKAAGRVVARAESSVAAVREGVVMVEEAMGAEAMEEAVKVAAVMVVAVMEAVREAVEMAAEVRAAVGTVEVVREVGGVAGRVDGLVAAEREVGAMAVGVRVAAERAVAAKEQV